MIVRSFRSTAAVVGCAAALACVGLPAAEATAAGSTAADFSQSVPPSTQLREPSAAAERIAARRNGYGIGGPVLYRSAPARAPHSFDVVGVAGEMHALEFRAKRIGGAWSDWAETDNGDPVYTGGTEVVQVRSRGVPIEGRLHYVRVAEPKGAPPLPEIHGRSVAKRTGVPAPTYISRAAWGANAKTGGCPPKEAPLVGRVKAGAIHHTVSLNTYTEAEAPAMVLAICRYHRYGNGWNDIGYNALVDRFGNLYEGRAGGLSRPIVGAQAEGVNSYTTGIATIGDHRLKSATSKERQTIVRYLAWKLDLAGVAATGHVSLLSAGGETSRASAGERIRVKPVFSHSDTNFTECAGDALRAQIPGIRRAVQRRLEHYGSGTPGEPTGPVDPEPPGGVTPHG